MATIYSGADVSQFQGTINWASYAAAKSFVIIKAAGGDAGLYTDANFYTNQAGARAQSGLRIGYYFFGSGDVNPTTAANYFISVVGTPLAGELFVLDIENEFGNTTPDDTWAHTFCTVVHSTWGFYPLVYMSQFSPTSSSLSWPTTNPIAPFWMANYSLSSTDFSQTTGNADATWGGLAAPNYRILQYTDVGSVSGISGNVDLDSFYSPNNTLNDWNALGYGGSTPTAGVHTTFSTFNVTPTFTKPLKQTIAVPKNNYDRVIYSTTWSDTVTSSTWPVNRSGPATNINQTAYPVGTYQFTLNGSGDGSWNDFSFIYSASDLGTFIGTIPGVVIQPIVGPTGALTFDVSVTTGSGSQTVAYTVNVALLASLSPSIGTTTVTQKYAYSNKVPKVSSYAAYRRIYADGSVTGTGNHTIPHGQGQIPNIIAFPNDSGGDTFINPTAWGSTGSVTSAFGMAVDSTNLYLHIDSALTGGYYRIYEDN